jgi:hypothetical protein
VAGRQPPGATKDPRAVVADAPQFIADAVKGIAASGAAGVNLDWEPYAKGMTKWTPGDGDGVRAGNLKGGAAVGSASASVAPLHRPGWVRRPGPPRPRCSTRTASSTRSSSTSSARRGAGRARLCARGPRI